MRDLVLRGLKRSYQNRPLSSLLALIVATISAICKASPTNWKSNAVLWTLMVEITTRFRMRSIFSQIRHAIDAPVTRVKTTCANTGTVSHTSLPREGGNRGYTV